MKNIKIEFNSPVILGFAIICAISLLLNTITSGYTNSVIFSTYSSSMTSPMTYIRLIGHVFGHVDMTHLIGNLMMILLVGPLLEEKYGSV